MENSKCEKLGDTFDQRGKPLMGFANIGMILTYANDFGVIILK
jgi:hypothetical protein